MTLRGKSNKQETSANRFANDPVARHSRIRKHIENSNPAQILAAE